MTIPRRDFLSASVLTAVAASFPTPTIFGAEKNQKYRVALVGCGWWGTNILNAALASKTVEPVALVDVDKRQLETELKNVKDKTGLEPKTFSDFREMLEQTKPDIVINATPDHWHALITIAACKAGAHVYVEKPICHTINEGIAMVKTARETNRTVQVGTHRRVSPHNQAAIEFLKSGKLGKIGHVRTFVNYSGGTGKITPDAPIPDGLDWDFWCGPAPLLPYNPRMHPRGFRQFMEFANGQISDWGIHWLDQVLWWAQDEQYPKSVASAGGRFVLEDNSTWPDTQHVVYQFDKFDLVWEHRLYSGNPPEKHNIGVYFYGTNGVLHLGWLDGWTYYPNGTNKEPTEHGEPKLDKPDDQNIANLWTDFIDAIQTGRKPIADIENGHRSTTLALLAVLSLKLGRGIVWDGKNQTIPNDPEALKLLSRQYREPWKYPE
ncbi:MAG: Gfo/Idh/MocA family oxidoreductase [Planctomycetaceae bacterium]|jgi:predicted dehydrogenase|nr:Gfo/Idh/MocA family oxidoreductase [Planctomycetaceae bacterium]